MNPRRENLRIYFVWQMFSGRQGKAFEEIDYVRFELRVKSDDSGVMELKLNPLAIVLLPAQKCSKEAGAQ
jgi:hypothetical protein